MVDADPDHPAGDRLDLRRLPVPGNFCRPRRRGVLPRFREDEPAHSGRYGADAASAWLAAVRDDGGWFPGLVSLLYTPAVSAGRIGQAATAALQLPPQQSALRRGRRRQVRAWSPSTRRVDAGAHVTPITVKLQTGYLYHYAFDMLIGVAGFIT